MVYTIGIISLLLQVLDQCMHNLAGSGYHIPTWIAMSPMYLWFLIFFTRPHKVRICRNTTVICQVYRKTSGVRKIVKPEKLVEWNK